MTRLFAAILASAVAIAAPALAKSPEPIPASQESKPQPVIQIALLLDTSNSMDGLIGQAKSQLWKIVNEFARARYSGKAPRLEVALYEYGNDRLSAKSGFLRKVSDLTADLDRVSEQLHGLTTSGGDEFCGEVIDAATRELEWRSSKGTLKMIFIAGNEPFTQGDIDYTAAVRRAISKGITVNTIFCGSEQQGIRNGWKQGALLGDGRYSFIDSNRRVAHIAAPQDAELARLGRQLNETYIAFGAKGSEAKARQAREDRNAESAGQGAGVNRALAKAKEQYRAEDWDLVDATAGGRAMTSVAPAALPAEMQTMDEAERQAFVAEKAKEREQIRTRMRKLEAQRRAYLAAEEKKRAASGAATFDGAILDSLREQAARANFSLD
ncbi:MAG: VWA domain-containing protein [Myxococcales bacterium]